MDATALASQGGPLTPPPGTSDAAPVLNCCSHLAASIRSDFRARIIASAASSVLASDPSLVPTRMPVTDTGPPKEVHKRGSQDAEAKVTASAFARRNVSGVEPSVYAIISTFVPLNRDKAARIVSCCSGLNERGDNFSSSLRRSTFALMASFLASSPRAFASAIFSSDFLLSSDQWCSLTCERRTIKNVEITPTTRLESNARLATSDQNVADDRDISENGHIRFLDWFFVGGIAIVFVGRIISIWLQILHILRRPKCQHVDRSPSARRLHTPTP